MNTIDVSIIVPLYNEQESVKDLYNKIKKSVDSLGIPYELIFVDDGSVDDTFPLANKLALQDTRLKVIKFRKNFGQTPAMVAGLQHAKGNILITMDGDLQNDPRDISNFITKINEGYDIVVGWRQKRKDKLITRKIPSKIANWLIGKVTGVPIKDNGCSLKAYRHHIITHIPLYSEMHRFIPAMASIAGIRIAEIKVRHHPRKYGQSKYGLSRIYRVMLDIISIKTLISFSNRPLLEFGIISMPLFILSLFFFFLTIGRFFLVPGESVVVLLGVSLLLGSLASFLVLSGILCELIYHSGNLKVEDLSHLTMKEIEKI
jgi:glycosyltransferase involved in cell wall biosynthesis